MRQQLAFVLAAFCVALLLLASGLRPDAFFVGDPGVKLISARNALAFPTHPLNVPLPLVGADRLPLVEPFFAVHGDHAHAITSELFPLVSAPLLAILGLRGLYVWPALGFLVTVAATGWLAYVLDRQRSPAVAALVVGLGTPFLFYGLEFWEHTPALALGVSGAAWLLAAARSRPGRDAAVGSTFAAGVLSGSAIVLRPEAACFIAAVLIASRALVHRPSWRTLAVFLLGAIVALLPLEVYTLLHFGALVPGHVSTNAGLIDAGWASVRLTLMCSWLLPHLPSTPHATDSLWIAGPAAILAVVSLTRPSRHDERGFLLIAAALTIAFTMVSAPNAGGGQWGPRYLLFAYVPLALLAADLVQQFPRRSWAGITLVVVLIGGGVWTQRAAYRELRGAKAGYGRVADFVANAATPGVPVVTDLWWLDQVAASALDGRVVLYTGDPRTAQDVVRKMSDLTVPTLTVFRSREESTDLGSWSTGTCYFEEDRREIVARGLVAIRLRHRCGYAP